MDSPQHRVLPSWVRKRDGRTEPFDADKINRTLFAATASLGQADAFVARELTDGVLHFLPTELEGSEVKSEQIEETIVKVVRELGQPRLAEAYAAYSRQRDRTRPAVVPRAQEQRHGPTDAELAGCLDAGLPPSELRQRAGAVALSSFSLRHVYSPNLAAACQEGLLHIDGLDHPQELAAAVLPIFAGSGATRGQGVFERIHHARQYVGGTLALDAPERDLAQRGGRISEAAHFIRELHWAATTLGLKIVLNLGSETGPSWADDAAPGPLFAEQWKPESAEHVLGFLEVLLDQFLALPAGSPLRLDWHLTARDFDESEGRQRLLRLIRAAQRDVSVRFVFDRARRPIATADGLDRSHNAALVVIGLHLPTLLQRTGTRVPFDTFIAKVQSLARLGASAGVQKRDFIRTHGWHDRPAFILDRAHIVMRLLGLDEALATLFDGPPWEGNEGWASAQTLAQRLTEALQQETRHIHVTCLLHDVLVDSVSPREPKDQESFLRHAGKFHATCGRGTLLVPLSTVDPSGFLELLHFAWKHTGLCRVGLMRPAEAGLPKQLTAGWKEV